MADRMIKNVSNLQQPLPIHVKGYSQGNDIVVQLSAGEVFWCPNDDDTKSLLIYSKKQFLELARSDKPEQANYYESYPASHWEGNVEKVADTSIEVPTPTAKTTPAVAAIAEVEETANVKWEEEDKAWLVENYPKHGNAYCAEKLGRTKSSIKRKVEALGLKRAENDNS